MIPDAAMELARKLQRLRMHEGMSTYALAKRAGFSQSKVSRLERGITRPSPADIRRLLSALDVQESIIRALVEDAADLGVKLRATRQPETQTDFIHSFEDLYHEVSIVAEGSVSFVCGLFQTPEYVEAVHRVNRVRMPLSDYVASVLKRQAVALAAGRETRIVMDETVFHRRLVSERHHVEQIESIRRRMRLRGIELGIVPMENQISVMPIDQALFTGVAHHQESWPFQRLTEQKSDLRQAKAGFDMLAQDALWGADADRLLKRKIEQFKAIDLRSKMSH